MHHLEMEKLAQMQTYQKMTVRQEKAPWLSLEALHRSTVLVVEYVEKTYVLQIWPLWKTGKRK